MNCLSLISIDADQLWCHLTSYDDLIISISFLIFECDTNIYTMFSLDAETRNFSNYIQQCSRIILIYILRAASLVALRHLKSNTIFHALFIYTIKVTVALVAGSKGGGGELEVKAFLILLVRRLSKEVKKERKIAKTTWTKKRSCVLFLVHARKAFLARIHFLIWISSPFNLSPRLPLRLTSLHFSRCCCLLFLYKGESKECLYRVREEKCVWEILSRLLLSFRLRSHQETFIYNNDLVSRFVT